MIIELKNIVRKYKSSFDSPECIVLDDVSVKINNSESIAITGPSGVGKSTLLNIIAALDLPTAGVVKWNDKEIAGFKENDLAAMRALKVGFVFQLHHLFPQLSLLENVLVPTILLNIAEEKKDAKSRASELLSMVGLADKIYQRPYQLSVGECQRAAVVRALINNPEVILADEPTGALDSANALHIGNLLAKINLEQHVAIVLVTHSTKLASLMKTKYKLEEGKLGTL